MHLAGTTPRRAARALRDGGSHPWLFCRRRPQSRPGMADAVDEGFDCGIHAQGDRRVGMRLPLPTFTSANCSTTIRRCRRIFTGRVRHRLACWCSAAHPRSARVISAVVAGAHGCRSCIPGMQPPRPLVAGVLPAGRVQYHYLREREGRAHRYPTGFWTPVANFVATPQLRLVLDDAGLAGDPGDRAGFSAASPTSSPSTDPQCVRRRTPAARTTTAPCCFSCPSGWSAFARQ